MALGYYVGSFACPASTGSYSNTSPGFTPKLVRFFNTGQTADGASGADNLIAYGAAVSTSSRFGITASNNPNRRQDNTKCIALINGAGTVTVAADFVQFTTSGFDLTFSTVTSGIIINFIALGDTDVTDVAIVQFTSPTSTGNQTPTTSLTFQPDVVLFATVGEATAPPTTQGSRDHFGFGGMTGAAQWCSTTDWAVSATPNGYQRTNACIAVVDGSSGTGTVILEANAVSLNSNGFTINWTTVQASARYVWAICIKGGQYALGAFGKPTATGNHADVTGLSFTPVGAEYLSYGLAAGTVIADNGHRMTVGAASGTANRGTIAQSIEGGFSVFEMLDRTKAIKIYADSTVLGAADHVSFGSGSITNNWTTADATARQILYLAVGPAAASLSREQEGYRFRNDDGSESTATWKAAQDTDVTAIAKLTNTRLRVLVNATSDPPAEAVKLQYRRVGATPWRDVQPTQI